MEVLTGGYTLDIPQGAFPLSTDSILLSDFAKLKRNAKVLDLGSGCGTLGLLLCAKEIVKENDAYQSAGYQGHAGKHRVHNRTRHPMCHD